MYSQIPEHMDHLQYLFFGLHGHGKLVPWMWTAMALITTGIILLLIPKARQNENVLAVACVFTFIGIWIDKGMGMVAGGFVPNPLHEVNEYFPTFPEVMIAVAVYATGFLILTILYKVFVGVKEELSA
jgi:molybdopterin-containing oxidoreductase family membrane subunit